MFRDRVPLRYFSKRIHAFYQFSSWIVDFWIVNCARDMCFILIRFKTVFKKLSSRKICNTISLLNKYFLWLSWARNWIECNFNDKIKSFQTGVFVIVIYFTRYWVQYFIKNNLSFRNESYFKKKKGRDNWIKFRT